jgi:hypothetical protein
MGRPWPWQPGLRRWPHRQARPRANARVRLTDLAPVAAAQPRTCVRTATGRSAAGDRGGPADTATQNGRGDARPDRGL